MWKLFICVSARIHLVDSDLIDYAAAIMPRLQELAEKIFRFFPKVFRVITIIRSLSVSLQVQLQMKFRAVLFSTYWRLFVFRSYFMNPRTVNAFQSFFLHLFD